jgi:NADPH:quinone reductase-like Zn-dependent oxidoreductase
MGFRGYIEKWLRRQCGFPRGVWCLYGQEVSLAQPATRDSGRSGGFIAIRRRLSFQESFMRSASYSSFGNPADVLAVEERPTPAPGPGQVRIRMTMAAIHNHDLLTIEGKYGVKPELPAGAGTEATGMVDALGDGVTHLKIGQRVAVSGQGTWADYYIADAARAVPLPDSIPDEAAAQLVSMPLSALVLLDFVEAVKGDWIIQNAANGAVGVALAMFAKRRGVNIVNLVRRDGAVTELAELGIGNVVSTSDQDWKQQVAELTGGAPLKAAVDGVGGPASGDLLSVLGEKGTLVSFGLMSGEPMQLSSGDMIFKQSVVKGFWLAKIGPTLAPETMKGLIGEIVQGVASGEVKLAVSDVFDLDDVAKAVAAAGEPRRKGKVLIRA